MHLRASKPNGAALYASMPFSTVTLGLSVMYVETSVQGKHGTQGCVIPSKRLKDRARRRPGWRAWFCALYGGSTPARSSGAQNYLTSRMSAAYER